MIKTFQTIFSNTSSDSDKIANKREDKVSYWLKKLHRQEEKIQSENGKRQIAEESNQTLRQEGTDRQIRNHANKEALDRQEINDLVQKSNRCIITISSLFPWDFFPTTMSVEESRITFIFRQFLSSQSHSVEIKDISNVFIESSPFFASLQVVSRTFIQNDIKISHLNRNKANKARMIIEGLRTFAEHNINTSNYEIDELIAKIEEFHTNKRL